MVFPVVMYGCESWTIKNADCRRIDAFELWCWRRLLRVPWTARRSSQSILKEISSGCSLEGLMLKLKLQYFLPTWCEELTHWKRPWCWERLRAGGEGDDRGWDGWMVSPTWWTWVWVNSRSWWWTGRPGELRFMGSQSRTRLSDWTELNWTDAEEASTLFSSQWNSLIFSKGKEMKVWAVGESGRGMWCWSGNCVNLTRACPHWSSRSYVQSVKCRLSLGCIPTN